MESPSQLMLNHQQQHNNAHTNPQVADLKPLVKGHLNVPLDYAILPDSIAIKKISQWRVWDEGLSKSGFGSARRAIIIGLDGVGGYYLDRQPPKFQLTNLQKYFIEGGSHTTKARSITPAISKPNWGTILCSAGLSCHGIKDNDWVVGRADQQIEGTENQAFYFPSIYQALKEQLPDNKTASFTDWIGWNHLFPNSLVDTTFTSINDPDAFGTTTAFLEKVLLSKDRYALSCIHMDDSDETGHFYGWGSEEYWKAIQIQDQCIGIIMAGLERLNLLDETLVVVVSDHGGELKDHGQSESDANMVVPIFVRGPQVKKNFVIETPSMGMDIAATVMWALGLNQPEVWEGRPLPVFE